MGGQAHILSQLRFRVRIVQGDPLMISVAVKGKAATQTLDLSKDQLQPKLVYTP